VAQTLGISVIGTLLGAILGVLLGVPAAAAGPENDRARSLSGLVRIAIRWLCRVALSLLRSIPEVLWS